MTISPRTASGAALSRASNASASPRQGAVDRAGSSGPGDYVSEGGYSVIKPGNSRRRYYVVNEQSFFLAKESSICNQSCVLTADFRI